MNERIKQFAQHAGFKINYQHADVQQRQLARLEEFAALIVKECANAILENDIEKADNYDANSPFFAGWERGCIDSASVIKEHFGVEE